MAARTPGPIAAAEPLLATLGEYRQLHFALAEADAAHPWLQAIELPTELELEAVEALEQALAASFSDALLAVYASRVPHLEDAFEMQLATLPELAEEAWAVGCPADMLAVARQADLFYCVPRREHAWAATVVTPVAPARRRRGCARAVALAAGRGDGGPVGRAARAAGGRGGAGRATRRRRGSRRASR
jgi:hypothetical protein